MARRQRVRMPPSSRRRRQNAETAGAVMGSVLIEYGHDFRLLEALVGSRPSELAPTDGPSTTATVVCAAVLAVSH
jgi:hypothetical protein